MKFKNFFDILILFKLGVENITMDEIKKIAEVACASGETIHNCRFIVTPEEVVSAIIVADKLGKLALKKN
jgi:glycerol dehydrogenase